MLDKRTLLLRWVVIIGLPLVVVLTSARALIMPWYPSFEYAKADFPPSGSFRTSYGSMAA